MTVRSPGDIILQDALKHLKVDQSSFADAMGMNKASISRLLSGKAAITPEMALRLEAVLNEPAEYWLSLQASYDIEKLRQSASLPTDGLRQLEGIPCSTMSMDMLRDLFDKYRAASEVIPTEEIRAVCSQCGVDNMYYLMRRVDPDRKVFDYPYTAEERGRNALPVLEDTYDFCSDYFDDFFIADEHVFPGEFLDELEDLRKNGNRSHFYRGGYLVWNRKEKTHGYLIMKHVGNMAVPVMKDIAELNKRYGNVVAYACQGAQGCNDGLAITAVVQTVKELRSTPGIFAAIEETTEKWLRKSVKKKIRNRTFGDHCNNFA